MKEYTTDLSSHFGERDNCPPPLTLFVLFWASLASSFGDQILINETDDEMYTLLPPRVIAYSFRVRKFFVADIDCVSHMTSTKHSFRDLKIDRRHKIMVKSLARSHFEKQDMRRQSISANLDQDFIRGKGAGLIILLHGVPG